MVRFNVEVIERLLRRRGADDFLSVKAYAYETAFNILKDRARRRRTRWADAHITFNPDTHGEMDVSPEHLMLLQENIREVELALAKLPERTREVFLARRVSGQRNRDIAGSLGISVSAVEKHMTKAVSHLSEHCGEFQSCT